MIRDQLQVLRAAWDRLKLVPGGKKVFSKIVSNAAPYTGTIDPRVLELRRGYAKVEMRDRRRVRNHLKSVHAIALMNLAEVASGLAFTYSLPAETRAILTGLSIDYVKKGRGTLTAECYVEPPESGRRQEREIEVVTRDKSGDVITRAQARWLVGPIS